MHAAALEVAAANLPYNLASLRTNELKPYREGRQCALFCYGVGQRFGLDVRFAFAEEQDIDFVARFERNECVHFVPLQMKELVPERVRDSASLQNELNKLAKYGDSSDLVVAFHLNRGVRVVPSSSTSARSRSPSSLWFVGYRGKARNGACSATCSAKTVEHPYFAILSPNDSSKPTPLRGAA